MCKLPKEFIEKLKSVTAKRPATIINHILLHGKITSEEIKDIYGYNHPPKSNKGCERARYTYRNLSG